MGADIEWTRAVAALRDEASELMDVGRLDDASACVEEALAIVDREGGHQHLVFASVLCVAADLAMAADVESGASLFRRAHDVALASGEAGVLVATKALWGLADADVDRGWNDRAKERYEEALGLLRTLDHPDVERTRAAIEASLRELSAAPPAPRKPWWRIW